MTLPLILVVAVAKNGVIGRDNQLLWRLKTDLGRFRRLTMGKPMIMGRKTFQSIGKPLPWRQTVVLTRDPGFAAEGAHVAHTWEEAVARGSELAAAMGADAVAVAHQADDQAETVLLHMLRGAGVAGGLLGIGSRTSLVEKEMLARLEKAFSA